MTADILKPYEDQIGNIAKIHLLAGPDVCVLVVAVSAEVGRAIIELTLGRVPLEITWRQAKSLDDRAGEIDQAGDLWHELLPKYVQFTERCARRAGDLSPMIGEIVLAIRKDLQMPVYLPNFPKLLAETARSQIDQLQTSVAGLLTDLETTRQIKIDRLDLTSRSQ